MEKDIWERLFSEAERVRNARTLSPFVTAGGVSAAVLTKAGNIYVGVCIDTACSLGMCAERSAIANMITNGERETDKVVVVMGNGKAGLPCGACVEFMAQLGGGGDIEVLLDYESRKTARLKELMPNWWGTKRLNAEQEKTAKE